MKSIFTLFALVVSTMTVFCQTPITINASDVPIPYQTFNFDETTTENPVSPSMGSDKIWDYSTYFGDNPSTTTYFEEVDTFFTNFGVDNYTSGFKSLTSQLGYDIYNELDFNNEGVNDIGVYIEKQVYSLQNFTGNPADNITFPLQGYVVNTPRRIMKFPMAINSSWSSETQRSNDFTLKIAAFGLNDVPSNQVYYTIRKDTIIGWGKLRVYTPQGPSIAYDVLVDKVLQYNVDSFYVGGAPAPFALTNAFGIKQGQITDEIRQYNFFRPGTFANLMRINYGTDTSYTKVQSSFVNTDNISIDISSTDNEYEMTYTTVLFSNPVLGNTINLMITNIDIGNIDYELRDINGKMLQMQKNIALQGNMLSIDIETQLATGTYFLQIIDKNNRHIATEKVSIIR